MHFRLNTANGFSLPGIMTARQRSEISNGVCAPDVGGRARRR